MSNVLHLAETFVSVQGEGPNAGVKSFFIRLAGCPVGKSQPGLPSVCHNVFNKSFLCDTDYSRKFSLSVQDTSEVIERSGCGTVVITGGEPLAQVEALENLIKGNRDLGVVFHLETSGTIPIPARLFHLVVCSPKRGFLDSNDRHIDAYKFVLTSLDEIPEVQKFLTNLGPIIQPVFVTFDCNLPNKLFTKAIYHPYWGMDWKLYKQLHKLIGLS